MNLQSTIPPVTESEGKKRNLKQTAILLAIAFAVPFFIMFIIYICMEVWPFGSNSVLVLDLNGQYVSFYEELRRLITEGGSLLYSWNRALGGEFMGIYAYYIASPFAFLVALFPKGMITEALLLILLLKCGSCGATMAFYLNRTRPASLPTTVIFSTMYALSAYAVVQQHNTMWIDSLILLPLLIYSIENLVKRKKIIMYIIVLALIVFTHYYIGYMVCIFTIFYYFYYYIIYDRTAPGVIHERVHFLRSSLRILFASILAIGIAMLIISTAYYSLTFGKTEFSNPSYEFVQRFDFLDFIVKLFPGSYDTVRPEGLPFVYVGSLALILVPLYFLTQKIRPKERIGGGLLLILLLVLFDGSTLDLIMHGFQKPNWLNYRYSFIFCFLLCVFSYKAFLHIKDIKFPQIAGVCAILGILLVVIQKQNYEFLNDFACIWYSFICIAVMIIGLYIVKSGCLKEFGRPVLLIFVCLELCISGLLNTVSLDEDVVYTNRTAYVDFANRVTPIVEMVQAGDDSFYRMEKTVHRKTNDNMMLDMKGVSNSTSTLNASVVKLLKDLGLSSKSHWSKYVGSTPVTDSLLGIKYVITELADERPLYEQIYDYNDDLTAYLNPYALSVAYAASPDIKELVSDDYKSPFEYMNAIVTALLGEDDTVELFREIKIESTDYDNCDISLTTGHRKISPEIASRSANIFYTLKSTPDRQLFMFFPSDYPREVEVVLNGEGYGTFYGSDSNCIISLGSFTEEDGEINIKLTLKDDNFYVKTGVSYFYYLDDELFTEVFTRLAKGNFNISKYSDTRLEGNISIPDGMTTLFTTIPYDEGWSVTVDGERAELVKTVDSLLAVDITAGSHNIVFNYMPRAFVFGAFVSLVSLAIFLIIIALHFLRLYRISRKKAVSRTDNLARAAAELDIMLAELPSEKEERSENADNILALYVKPNEVSGKDQQSQEEDEEDPDTEAEEPDYIAPPEDFEIKEDDADNKTNNY